MASHLDKVKFLQKDYLNTKDDWLPILQIKDGLGRTALSYAAILGDLDLVEYLHLKQGFDINVLDNKNMSPLQHAVQSTEWNVARYLVDQGADVNVPDKDGITVLQRAIKAGKWDVVKYMIGMGADVNVLDHARVSPVQYAVEASEWDVAKYMVEKGGEIDTLTSEQKDMLLKEVIGQAIDMHNAFYNVVRMGNSELLEMLIRKKGLNNVSNNPDIALKLDHILAKTYEELKITNVPMSPEIETEVEKKLISLRFFNDKNDKNDEVVKASLSDVKKRVEIVSNHIGILTQGYSGAEGKEVDGEFLLVSRFVAQNIRILKRQLKSTYYTLPWEEMEFCLSIYISFYTHDKVNYLYKLVLDKERLLTNLSYFSEKLNEVKSNLRDEDIDSKFPQKNNKILSARNEAFNSVISSNPLFQDLYNDYDLIKNAYSLKRIESYIKLALSLNLDAENKKDTDRLVIERTLQVVGESLKNSLESPNISDDVHGMLLHYAPKNVREIITSLRDSLSHAPSIKTKIHLEDNDDPRFFRQVQNDLRKIEIEITDILYKKNQDIIATFFNKIIESKNPIEVNKLCKRLFGSELLEEIKIGDSNTKELKKTKELVQELVTEFKDQTGFEVEKQYLNKISNKVDSQEKRLADVKLSFTRAVEVLATTINQVNQNMVYNLDSIKNMALTFLKWIKPPIKTEARKEILLYAQHIHNGIEYNKNEEKIANQKSAKILKLLYDITCNVDFKANRVKDIHTFKERLEKKENISQSGALERMKSILNEIEKSIKVERTREIFKKTLITREKMHRMKQNLLTFFVDMNSSLGYKNEELVQKYNDLVNELEIKKKKKDVLKEEFNKADWKERQQIIGKLDDKYQTLLSSVINSFNSEKSTDLCKSFQRFFSSSKELNAVIDDTLKTNKDQFQSYYEKRLTKLNQLFSTNSGSVDNALELVSKYKNNKEFQSALDMLVLDLTDILDNSSLFGDNKLYLDGYSPMLVGKPLRNYLAHGDALIDTLPFNPSTAIILNAILLLKANKDLVIKKSLLVGQRTKEAFDNLNKYYNDNLDLITHQIEMYTAATEGNVHKVKSCVEKGVDINSRDIKGWTGMHYAAQSDRLEVVKYFLDQNLIIDIYDVTGKNVLHVAGTYGSDNVINYLIKENKVNVNSISGAKKTILHYVASSDANMDVVRVLLDKGALVDARDNENQTPLHFSALRGREDVALALLEKGATVDASDGGRSTPLHLASYRGHQKVAEVLLQKGAKVNALDKDKRTPLHMAALSGHKNVAVTLLENGADVCAYDLRGYTPLQWAVSGGKLDFVEMLLMHKDTKINDGNMYNMTPLHMAVQFGHKDVTLMLLKKGANVNALNINENSPLHLAVRSGHLDIVLTLLEQQYNVDPLNNDDFRTDHQDNIANKEIIIDILNKDESTPLLLAAGLGHRDILLALLEKGANIETIDKYGMTPLNNAAWKAHHDVVEILLQNKATVHTKNVLGFTPLHSAAISGNPDIVLALLKKGSQVDEVNNYFNTSLHIAVEKGHKEVVVALLNSKADIEAKGVNSFTPLHIAARYGHKEIAKELLSRNAEIEAVLIDGSTTLHTAAYFGQYDVAHVLLEKAKVDARMENGSTPLYLASQNGYPEVAQLLLNKNADVNALGKDARTPLHMAAQNGHHDVTMVLLDNHAKVEALDANKSRPLHLAVEKGHIEVVEALLYNKADVNASNVNRITPLQVAAFNGYKDIVELLLKHGAEVNSLDKDDRAALHFAASAEHGDVVKVLLDGNANVDSRDCDNRTPLHFAVKNRHTDVCIILLNNGADFLARDNHNSVLHQDVSGNNEEILKLILHKILEKYKNNVQNWYVSINAQDADSDTPLMWAAEEGKVDAAKILLEYGADVDAQNNAGRTALHYATVNDHLDIVKILIDNKANALKKDNDGKTPYDLAQEKYAHLPSDNENNAMIIALLLSVSEENHPPLEHLSEQEQQDHVHLKAVNDFLETGADVSTADVKDMTPLMSAAKTGNVDAAKILLEHNADIDAQNNDGWTALHYATVNDRLEIVQILIDNKANANKKDKAGKTPCDLAQEKYAHLTTENEKNTMIIALLMSVTEEYHPPLERFSEQEQQMLTENLAGLEIEQENVGLEPFGSPSSGPSCSWQHRKKRNIRHCTDEESRSVFPYEPLEESVSREVAHCAKIYTQVTMAVAVKHSSQYLNGDINAALDSIITYNNNIGDIISEQTTNHSPREQHILGDYYENAQEFFKDYPVTTVLNQVQKISNVAKNTNSVTESWLFENGQHTMFMFKDGSRYQLYSTDFNYRHRFRTREDITFDEAEGFIKAFFQWRSGSSKYKTFTLKESVPEKLLQKLQRSPFWFPDKVVPDGILLTNEHLGRIESLRAEIVREIFFVSGQTPDVAALHADFFQQHKGKLSLRVEMLHKKLPSLREGDIQALLMIVRKYDCPIDETYLNYVSAAERALLESYHSRVALELKTAVTISSKRLSELSWVALHEGLARHPDISAELTEKVMTATKELHATATKGAWVKGMATQTLFFLPDIIRATNTGDVTSLAQTGGMLTADATINNLYTGLINNLETVLPEGRLRLLRALPVTSPVFKALTVYSIVELTKQLRTLPASSETRGVIEHKLGEQYMTAGLMVAELLGFEVTPLWIGLIAEQLIFDADTFRKQNHLDVPFWEALLMSLGFEQEKLHAIIEERQLVDVNLSLVNKLNSKATIPYGWVIVKNPKLGEFKWVVVSQDQVPGEIRQKINSIKGDYSPTSAEQILASDGYRLVNKYKLKTYSAYSTVVVTRGKLITSYWQKGIYDADPKNVTVDFSLHHNDRQSFQHEDNVFLDQVLVDNVSYRRIPSKVGGRFLNGLDPIKRDAFGAAVYVNNQTSLDTRAQSSFYVGFDPREGDLGVDFTAEGLEKIDDMNVIHKLGVSSSTSYDSFNASSAYIVTVQVGFKPYPSAIEFSKQAGVFSLTDSSRRVVSQYLITGFIDYVIKDLTSVTRIVLSVGLSGQQYKEVNSACNTISNDESGAIEVKNWQCTTSIINGKNEVQKLKVINQGSIAFLGNKKYLQLLLSSHVIEKHLRVSAEHVDILEAKGEVVNPSTIELGDEVASFNITIRGDIAINNGATSLQITGKVPFKLPTVGYSKAARNKVIAFYELTVHDALRLILDTMSRTNTMLLGKQILELRFSSPELEYKWLNKLPQVNSLKIEGTLDGKVAFLTVEQNINTLNVLADDKQLNRVEVTHYDQRGIVDKDLILKEVIGSSKLNPTSKGSYQQLEDLLNPGNLLTFNIKSSNYKGEILVFQSMHGYDVYHWFSSSDIVINNISYVVKGKHICAVYGEGGVIDGRELINSGIYVNQSKFSKSAKTVGVCFGQSLKASKVVVRNDTLVINDLTLHHLADGSRIYFDEQAFPVRALRDSLVSNQSKVTGSIQHVHRRSLQDSNVEHGREYVVDLNNTSSTFEQSEVSSIIFSNIRPGKLKVAARNNDLVLSVSGSVHTLVIHNWNDRTGRSKMDDLQRSLFLKFRYARQVTEVVGVNRFELSETDHIQTLLEMVDVNYQISQQLEQLDAEVVDGLRYVFANRNARNVERYKCFGPKVAAGQQMFLASNNNSFDKELLKKLLDHEQTIPALIWLLSKGYSDYLLQNSNVKTSALLADIVDSCFDTVIDETIIHSLVKCFEDEDVVGEVERFIKHNSRGLIEKIKDYLHTEQHFTGDVKSSDTNQRFHRHIDEVPSKYVTNIAPSIRSSAINNMINWVKDKVGFLALNIISSGQTYHNPSSTCFAAENKEDLKNQMEETPSCSSSFQNLENLSLFNLNGTLVFADYLIRNFTKEKPYESKEQLIPLIEAQALALNITTEFEVLLEELSEERAILIEELAFNPVAIQKKVMREIINGNSSNLPQILFESIDCPHLAGKQTEILNCLKDKVAEMLRQHAGLMLIQESGDTKEGWMYNGNSFEENLKTTVELGHYNCHKMIGHSQTTPHSHTECPNDVSIGS